MRRPVSRSLTAPLLGLALCLAGCKSRGTYIDAPRYVPAEALPVARADVVRVGDKISVIVFGEELLTSRGIRVEAHGTIMLPLLGEVLVAGKEPATLVRELETALKSYVNAPRVTVLIDESPVVITVIGESRNNSRIEMEAPVRIVDALAQAGGLTEFADKAGIYVLRGDRRIRFEYHDIIRGAPYARRFLMMSGDVLVIED